MKAGEKIRLASESIRLQKERNAVLQQHNEILLFSSAPEGCNTNDAVAFFNLLRNEALQTARARMRVTEVRQDPDADERGEHSHGPDS